MILKAPLAAAFATAAIMTAAAACSAPLPTTPPTTPSPAAARSVDPAPAEPPLAVLTFPGGRPVAGDLGTYIFRGSGSDAPWLPGEPVTVPAAGAFGRVFLSEPVPVATWSATIAPAGRVPPLGGQQPIAAGVGAIELELPTGDWTLMLSVEFADGVGSAAWFWELGQR